jgi:hypothetical protein
MREWKEKAYEFSAIVFRPEEVGRKCDLLLIHIDEHGCRAASGMGLGIGGGAQTGLEVGVRNRKHRCHDSLKFGSFKKLISKTKIIRLLCFNYEFTYLNFRVL